MHPTYYLRMAVQLLQQPQALSSERNPVFERPHHSRCEEQLWVVVAPLRQQGAILFVEQHAVDQVCVQPRDFQS